MTTTPETSKKSSSTSRSRKRSCGDAPSTASAEPTGLHELERFTFQRIARADIKNSEYNPRTISDTARKKLKLGLQKLGLLQPLVWNKSTGNLVGGHQRLELLDKLANGTQSYELTVAAVELTPAAEVEANILLNNPEAMGEWDLGKLDAAMRTEGLRIEATGFDVADLFQVLGESPFAQEHALELAELAEEQRKVTGQIDAVAEAMTNVRDDSDFYIVVVFKDPSHRTQFLEALKLPDNAFQDGQRFRELFDVRGNLGKEGSEE